MYRNLYISLVSLLLTTGALNAQQNTNWCGTTGKSPWLDWYHANKGTFPVSSDTNWLYVPVTLQIVGTDQGTGYFRLESAIRAVCDMNDYFTDSRIRFYLMPGEEVIYLNNTSWYDHNWDGGAELINENKLPGRLNAFVVANPAGACGYSWYDAIVLGKNCSGAGNSTWSHEAGHHFSLPHPFYGWEGFDWDYSQPAPSTIFGNPVEKLNGSNCNNSGDFFCDTRPDYLNYRWQCNGDNESTVLLHDPNGEEFRADASLIMGYALDQCTSRFTPEQIDAMRWNLNTQHSDYLITDTPGPEIDDEAIVQVISPVDSQIVQNDDFFLEWDAVPNANIYTVEISPVEGMYPTFFHTTVVNTTSLHVQRELPANRTYYWHVKAYSNWDLCQPHTVTQKGTFTAMNLVATNELEKSISANLAPNPVAGGLPAVFSLTSDQNMSVQLEVRDAAGRVCQQRSVRLYEGENQLEIATDRLSAGIYFVSVQNEKGAIVKRLAICD